MENNKFNKKTDEQLVAKAHPGIWRSGDEGIAAAELYTRQKQRENKSFKLQQFILIATIFTIIIATITLFFVIRQFYQPIQFYQCPDKKINQTLKAYPNYNKTVQKKVLTPNKTANCLDKQIDGIKH